MPNNGVMRVGSVRRLLAAVVTALAGMGLVAFAAFLSWQGLDRADQWSSVIAGFAGLAGLIASAVSLMSGRGQASTARPELVPVRTVWGTIRMPLSSSALLKAQARAARSVPYRVSGVDAVPLAVMYVRQQLEVHRPGSSSEPVPPAIERMGIRLRPVSSTKVLPVAQKVESVLGRHRHLIIEGGPGMGKSSLGRHLTLSLTQAWLRTGAVESPPPTALFPVMVTARALSRHRDQPWLVAITRACAEELGQHADATVSGEALTDLPPGVTALVIVDGLDEVADEQRHELIEVLAERMAQADSRSRIVVLSRPLADAGWRRLSAGDTGVYSMLPFTRAALRDFSEAALAVLRPDDASEQTERFLDQLGRRELAEVARVPLLAAIAVTMYAADPSKGLPRTKYELYEQYVAHLAQASRHRRSLLRQRMRQQLADTGGPNAEAALDALFARTAELVEYVAVRQIDTDERLSDAAAQWCVQEGLWLRMASWMDVVQEVLTSTGLLVRREGDVLFIHRSFAEHVAADRRASQLPQQFDPAAPVWIHWIGRAIDDDAVGLAVLVRWARQHSPDAILDWLLDGSSNFQWLALELLAAGVKSTPARMRSLLSYVEERAHQTSSSNDWLLGPVARLAGEAVVYDWVRRMLRDAGGDPGMQAVAARLLSDASLHDRELAVETVERRLAEDLLPDRRLALIEAAIVLFGAADQRVGDQYRRVIGDPRATPDQRLVAGQAWADLGREHHDAAVAVLLRVLDAGSSSHADRAVAARVLADLLPERRRDLVVGVRAAFDASPMSETDRLVVARILAELDVEESSGGSEPLRALATDVALLPARRWEAASALADLGPRHREWAAHILRDMVVEHAGQPWLQAETIRQLGLLGPDYFGVLEDAAREFYGSRSMFYVAEYPSNWLIAARAAAKLDIDRRQHLIDQLAALTASADHPYRTAAAAALTKIDPSSFGPAVDILRSSIRPPLLSFSQSEAAYVLSEIDPSFKALNAATLRAIMMHGFGRWRQGLAALRLTWSVPDIGKEPASTYLAIVRSARTRVDARAQAAAWLAELEPSSRASATAVLLQSLAYYLNDWNLDYAVRILTSASPASYDQCVDRLTTLAGGRFTEKVRVRSAAALAAIAYAAIPSAVRTWRSIMADPHAAAADQLAAARELVRVGDRAASTVAVLEGLRTDPHNDFDVRLGAELLLTKIRPSAALEVALWIDDMLKIRWGTEMTRAAVAERLVVHRHPRAADAVIDILDDQFEDSWWQARAADLSIHCGPEAMARADEALRRRIDDPATADSVRIATLAVLGMLGPAEYREARMRVSEIAAATGQRDDVVLDACDALLQLGPTAELVLAERLGAFMRSAHLSPGARVRAIKLRASVVGVDEDNTASAHIAVGDPRAQPSTVVSAAELASRSESGSVGPHAALSNIADHPDLPPAVRVDAALTEADAFAGNASEFATRMDESLASSDPAQRLVASWVLSRQHPDGHEAASTVLRALAADPDIAVQLRWHAAVELGNQVPHRQTTGDLIASILDIEDLTATDRCQIAIRLAEIGVEGRQRAASVLTRELSRANIPDRHLCEVAATLARLGPINRDRGAAELQAIAADDSRRWPVRMTAMQRLSDLSPAYRRQAVSQTAVALETTLSAADQLTISDTLAGIAPRLPMIGKALHSLASDASLPPALRLRAADVAARRRCVGWLGVTPVLREIGESHEAPPHLFTAPPVRRSIMFHPCGTGLWTGLPANAKARQRPSTG